MMTNVDTTTNNSSDRHSGLKITKLVMGLHFSVGSSILLFTEVLKIEDSPCQKALHGTCPM